MKTLIIEDEELAAERLIRMISEMEPSAEIIATLNSVNASIKWFNDNKMPDLVFMDINLSDGSSFEIFKKINITCPIIFVTAFDQYAIDAFKVNSIDYILKPVKKDDLRNALDKYKRMKPESSDMSKIINQLLDGRKDYQKRIIIRFGENIKMVEVKDVAYFYTEDKINYLCTYQSLRYPVDFNLDELEQLVDPAEFFRINRQFIVNIASIEKMLAWSKSRVKILLKPASEIETIVSTDRSPHFKEWLTGKKEI
ncbi:MAG: LytTR family DNA-binding domain-containing protein [Bacteroidota bacterium]